MEQNEAENDFPAPKIPVKAVFWFSVVSALLLWVTRGMGGSVIAWSVFAMAAVLFTLFSKSRTDLNFRAGGGRPEGEPDLARNQDPTVYSPMPLKHLLFSHAGYIGRWRFAVAIVILEIAGITVAPLFIDLLNNLLVGKAALPSAKPPHYDAVFLISWFPVMLLFLHVKVSLLVKRFNDTGAFYFLTWLVIAANIYNFVFKGYLMINDLPLEFSFFRIVEMPILIFAAILTKDYWLEHHKNKLAKE